MKSLNSLPRPLRRRSPDLQSLIDEGFCLTFGEPSEWLMKISDWLKTAVKPKYWHDPVEWITATSVPYVRAINHGANVTVAQGDLAVPLWTERSASIRPKEHWALWHGEVPCFSTGEPRRELLAPGLETHDGVILLSQKPPPDGLYRDHYDKVMTYISFIEPQALKLDSSVSARCHQS